MDAVQAPIVAGDRRPDSPDAGHDLARAGRGALRTAAGGARRRARRAVATRRRTSTRTAPACRRCVERLIARSCGARTASTSRAAAASMVTAGAQHGVHARGARDHRAGRRDHPAGAVLLQSRDGDSDGRLPRGARRRPTSAISCDLDAIRARDHRRTRAIVTVSPNNPSGAVYPRSGAARGERAVRRARPLSHQRRGLRVLHLRSGAPCLAGLVRRRRRAHDLDVLAVEGVRLRRLAHRLHGVSGASGVGDGEDPGHDPGLSDRSSSQVAARRRARRRPRLLRAARPASSPRSATSSSPSSATLAPLASVPAADGAFYVLLRVEHRRSIRCRSPSG